MSIKRIAGNVTMNSICTCLLGLLFMIYSHDSLAGQKHKAKTKSIVQPMTVLSVAPANNNDMFITVIFQVSQRRYKIQKNANPAFLKLLRDSEKNHTPVLVERAKEESDVIVSVKKPK